MGERLLKQVKHWVLLHVEQLALIDLQIVHFPGEAKNRV